MILRPEIVCAYGLPSRRLPHPQVAPAEPPVAPLLRHHRRAVGPDVEEHQGRVGDASRRESGKHLWMLVQRMIDVVILVEGEVGTGSRLVSPRVNAITDKINNRLVCLVGSRSNRTESERLGIASPGFQALTSAFAGSLSSIEAKRQESVTPWSRRKIAAVL